MHLGSNQQQNQSHIYPTNLLRKSLNLYEHKQSINKLELITYPYGVIITRLVTVVWKESYVTMKGALYNFENSSGVAEVPIAWIDPLQLCEKQNMPFMLLNKTEIKIGLRMFWLLNMSNTLAHPK